MGILYKSTDIFCERRFTPSGHNMRQSTIHTLILTWDNLHDFWSVKGNQSTSTWRKNYLSKYSDFLPVIKNTLHCLIKYYVLTCFCSLRCFTLSFTTC